MKNLDFLFIGINFFPEPTGIGKYSGEMIEWLAYKGFEIEVVTGFPYYPQWQLEKGAYWYKTEKVFNSKVKVHRCPLYVPKQPSGFKRILHEFSFLLFAFPKLAYLSIIKKPKYIFCVAPPFHLGLLGYLAKLISGGKLLYHIQDLQIEAAQSLQMIRHPFLLKGLFKIEKLILDRADSISSIHTNMIREIALKTKVKIELLPNWTNLELLYPIENKNELREIYGLPSDKTIFLYSGSLGEKQGIELVFEIAKTFSKHNNCLFIIAGSGPYHQNLEKIIAASKLDNIVARKLVPIEELNNWLNLADYHLIFQRNEINNYLFPSKIVSILGIGGACIAFVSPSNNIGKLLNENQIGFVIFEHNPADIYLKLTEIMNFNADNMKQAARLFAIKNFDKNQILEKWLGNILFMKN